MRLTLRQLEHFCAVARTGSISAAAAQLRVSRTSVTEALDTLERISGTVLCRRSKAEGVVLTASGEDFFIRARSVLDQAFDLEVPDGDRQLGGTLAIGCFRSLAPTVLPALWSEFASRHPGVTVSVTTGNRAELVEQLSLGILDVVLAYNLHALPGLSSARLYDTTMYALLPADHRFAEQGRAPLAELAAEPLLLMDASPSSDDILSYFAHHGAAPNVRMKSPDFELIRSLVARGLGYSIFIQRPRQDVSYEGLPVACVPLDPVPHLERASIAWSERRRLPAPGRSFVDLAIALGPQVSPAP
ncbi:LysR substrate-binding domain-containing protein [Citricoccus sp. K5]|uniref:LysR substrate-binding domain-containing protein n=1 Tax=Citricoccus sp. K5 TaxID=2653135 RepID=UPI0012F1A816|nr:LysR substrate-binding domain-containing protein [Citricoccus sp. K5]VXB82883.1 LysR family transcriptional regulator [Citricoccus sp. K5]